MLSVAVIVFSGRKYLITVLVLKGFGSFCSSEAGAERVLIFKLPDGCNGFWQPVHCSIFDNLAMISSYLVFKSWLSDSNFVILSSCKLIFASFSAICFC